MSKQFDEFMNELKATMVQKVSEQSAKQNARQKIEQSIKLLTGLDPDSDLTDHMDDINETIQTNQSIITSALKELMKSYTSVEDSFTEEEIARVVTMGFMIDCLLNPNSSIDINDDGSLTIHDNPEFWKEYKKKQEEETTIEETEETEETEEQESETLIETFIKKENDPELKMVRLTWIEGVPKYRYFITNTGFVMEKVKDRICKHLPRKQYDSDRELIISLTPEKKAKVSHLVWEAFYPEFRGVKYALMYADGDPNNCELRNLQLQLKRQPELK